MQSLCSIYFIKSFWLGSICKLRFLHTINFIIFMYKAKLGKKWKIILTNKEWNYYWYIKISQMLE